MLFLYLAKKRAVTKHLTSKFCFVRHFLIKIQLTRFVVKCAKSQGSCKVISGLYFRLCMKQRITIQDCVILFKSAATPLLTSGPLTINESFLMRYCLSFSFMRHQNYQKSNQKLKKHSFLKSKNLTSSSFNVP